MTGQGLKNKAMPMSTSTPYAYTLTYGLYNT